MDDILGKTRNGYEFNDIIDDGTFGIVYRARQVSLDGEVAIKRIKPEYANQPDYLRAFSLEAQRLKQLEHPAIVPVIDFWLDATGAYIVMRLLPSSLKKRLEHGPLSPEEAGRLLEQIAQGLYKAHQQFVIHRDIKPANILLDEDCNAFIADFGIAKDLTASSSGTQSGNIVGTPAYLSPEQALGNKVTPQSDIYCLGIVLYHMLTGELPFVGNSYTEVLLRHVNESIPTITGLPVDICDSVNAVVQKATAKQPEARYNDVRELAQAFRQAIMPVGKAANPLMSQALTPQELAILRLVVQSYSNKEIAAALHYTLGTVKWYLTERIYPKLGVKTRSQARKRAVELKLVDAANHAPQAMPSIPTRIFDENITNPFKGILPFEQADAANFFGRDAVIQQLVHRMNEVESKPRLMGSRFLAILGPSGSGKSSVMKAGLLPALHNDALSGSSRWFVVEMKPGDAPLDRLEVELMKIAGTHTVAVHEQLRRDANGLRRVTDLILPDDGAELLVLVDQLEEIWTTVKDEVNRKAFIDQLYAAVTAPRSRVRVVVTLRADFYDRPLMYPEFGRLLHSRMETLLPLSAEELEQAITAPLARYNITFEAGLVQRIIQDVLHQPGALPLLQYALTMLFEQRNGTTITRNAYREIGGVVGALTRKADGLLNDLDDEGQRLAQQMFLSLVTPGEGVEDTRRRTGRAELHSLAADPELMDEIIDVFVSERLLSLGYDETTRTATVEVAHEALLREWQTLRTWVNTHREDLRMRDWLNQMYVTWLTSGKSDAVLVPKPFLPQFEEWQVRTTLALTSEQKGFLSNSIAHREAQERLKAEREAHEGRLLRRARNRSRLAAGVFATSTVIIAVLGASIFIQLLDTWRSLSNTYGSLAEEQCQTGYQQECVCLAVEAMAHFPTAYTPQAVWGLMRSLAQPFSEVDYIQHNAHISASPKLSSDGTRVLAGTNTGEIQISELNTGRVVQQFQHSAAVSSVEWIQEETLILSNHLDRSGRSIVVWDVSTGQMVYQNQTVPFRMSVVSGHETNGAMLIGQDGSLSILNVQNGEEMAVVHLPDGSTLYSAEWSPDGTKFLTAVSFLDGSNYPRIQVWDINGIEQMSFYASGGAYVDASWNSTGQYIMSITDYSLLWLDSTNQVQIWDVVNRREHQKITGVIDAQWSNNPNQFYTWPKIGNISRWDIESQQVSIDYTRTFGGPDSDDYVMHLVENRDGSRIAAQIGSNEQVNRLDIFDANASSAIYSTLWGIPFVADVVGFVGQSRTELLVRHPDVPGLLQIISLDTPSSLALRSTRMPNSMQTMQIEISGSHLQLVSEQSNERYIFNHPSDVRHAALDDHNTFVITLSDDLLLRVWNIDTSTLLREFSLPIGVTPETVDRLFLSENASIYMVATKDYVLYVVDGESGQVLQQLPHQNTIRVVSVDVQNTRVVTQESTGVYIGPNPPYLNIWDISAGRKLNDIGTIEGWYGIDAVWDSDGIRLLLQNTSDSELLVYNTQSNQFEFALFSVPGDASWSDDGQNIIIRSDTGTEVWTTDIGYYLNIARQRCIRPFTAEQREQFFLPPA